MQVMHFIFSLAEQKNHLNFSIQKFSEQLIHFNYTGYPFFLVLSAGAATSEEDGCVQEDHEGWAMGRHRREPLGRRRSHRRP